MEKTKTNVGEAILWTEDALIFIDTETISEEELLAEYDPTEEERMMGEA